ELNTICAAASTKSPCDQVAGAASLVVIAGSSGASAADVAAHDIAEQLPGLALEAHQLKLRQRREIGGAGVDLDAREEAAQLEILDAGGLLHDVRAAEVVAAGLQDMHQALSDVVAVHHRGILPVGVGIVLVEKFVPGLHAGIVLPLRI